MILKLYIETKKYIKQYHKVKSKYKKKTFVMVLVNIIETKKKTYIRNIETEKRITVLYLHQNRNRKHGCDLN